MGGTDLQATCPTGHPATVVRMEGNAGEVPLLRVVPHPRVVPIPGVLPGVLPLPKVVPHPMVVPLPRVVTLPWVLPLSRLLPRVLLHPKVVPGVVPLPQQPVGTLQMEKDAGDGLGGGHGALEGHGADGPRCRGAVPPRGVLRGQLLQKTSRDGVGGLGCPRGGGGGGGSFTWRVLKGG